VGGGFGWLFSWLLVIWFGGGGGCLVDWWMVCLGGWLFS
jgi:hypothetical protein